MPRYLCWLSVGKSDTIPELGVHPLAPKTPALHSDGGAKNYGIKGVAFKE
jgi:hypothetical protein